MDISKISNKKNVRTLKTLLIVVACAVFWTAICILGLLHKFDYRVYDLLLGLKKNPETRKELMILEADNISLEAIGTWPWSRDVYANALLRLKEFDVRKVVFDIEFLSPSSAKVDEDALNDEIANFDGDLPDFSRILVDNDDKFARAVQFFGNTWLTLNNRDMDIRYSPEEIEYVRQRFLHDVEDDDGKILLGTRKSYFESLNSSIFAKMKFNKIDWDSPEVKEKYLIGFSPALKDFANHSEGLGFPNVFIDADGTRRRIELLNAQEGRFAAQLSFSPLLDILTPEKIIRQGNFILLEKCKYPTPEGNIIEKNIKIPLDENGRMLINWKHEQFASAFKHDDFLTLFQMDEIEKNIISLLGVIQNFYEYQKLANPDLENEWQEKFTNLALDYSDIIEFKNFLLDSCNGYDAEGKAIGSGISSDDYEQYFALRKAFFETASEYAHSEFAKIPEETLAIFKDGMSEENFESFLAEIENIKEVFINETDLYNKIFKETYEKFKDSFCIIGNTASSTTDLGTTPFERSYPNVGTHANVYNTIMNEDFIRPMHWGLVVLLAILISFICAAATAEKKASVQNTVGFIGIAIVVCLPIAAMTVAGIYLPSVAGVLIVFSSYLIISVYRFTATEKDKKFLQTTFGAYVAPAVVDQIVKNPEIARLGGKSDTLTALFSDVKTFSGFTEVINNEEGEDKGAERLVAVLNKYLGVLSDAIMDNNGTIDKYVGDEIVSFFGAPVHDENNAFDACVAAVRMLQAEKKFNEENEDILPINPKTGKPFYLRSRVGLNTGNMVVGNMGTDKKLNYTIMGNNVNLASRLEGTNKVYGSWIMCSETTWIKANSGQNAGKLVARKFDCVRVINVNRPVPIYSIIGLKDELEPDQIRATELFNEGMKWYLAGSDTPKVPKNPEELKKAYEYYKKAYELYPEDESSKVFMERCVEFIKNGVPEIWDGVYVMKSK